MNELEFMFDEGPIREAMAIYLGTMYEENADFSEYSMKQEYIMLRERNELNLIFEAVQQRNRLRNEG